MDIKQKKRILIKISGEALSGNKGFGIDPNTVGNVADALIQCIKQGFEIAVVVGAGNFWRGRDEGMHNRSRSDYAGMLGTMINSLSLCDALEVRNMQARVMSAVEMTKVSELYIKDKAVNHLKKGRIVIFACGTGCPYFTTDTTAALRAAEIDADMILMAKNIDGVYDSDPKTNTNAIRYNSLSFMDIIYKDLKVMDLTAAAMCNDNKIPMFVFKLDDLAEVIKNIDRTEENNYGTYINTEVLGQL